MIKVTSFGSGSKGNCAILQNEDTNIMIDCGLSMKDFIKRKNGKLKLSLLDINALLITHKHGDHSCGLHWLKTYEIPTYMTLETITTTNSEFNEEFILTHKKTFKIGSIKVIALRVNHGDCECYGFIFADKDSRVLWLTDLSLLETNLRAIPFTEIYIETNYVNGMLESALSNDEAKMKLTRQINTHMGLDNAIEHLKHMDLSQCNKIVGIHLSKQLANADYIKKEIYTKLNKHAYCFNEKGDLI